MPVLWPLAVVLVVGVVLVLALFAGPRLFAGTQYVVRSFLCPFQGRDVTVEFEETVWNGRLVDVNRCSLFKPPTAVDCDKACANLKRRPRPRGSWASAARGELVRPGS